MIEKIKNKYNNFIHSTSNQSFVIRHLLRISTGLFVLLIVSWAVIAALALNRPEPKVFKVDQFGNTIEEKYAAFDASNEKRTKYDIQKFIELFFNDMYSYNSYSIKSNLKSVYKVCIADVRQAVEDIIVADRKSFSEKNMVSQSCSVISIIKMEDTPNLKLSIDFTKKQLNSSNSEEASKVLKYRAIIRMQMVPRSTANLMGWLVLGYEEDQVRE